MIGEAIAFESILNLRGYDRTLVPTDKHETFMAETWQRLGYQTRV